jgi:hypothetical protein
LSGKLPSRKRAKADGGADAMRGDGTQSISAGQQKLGRHTAAE